MKRYLTTKTKEVTKTLTGAQYIADILGCLNVSDIFGYPGAPVLPLYDALADTKIKHVLCRHEQGAVHAAEGYAKIKDKPGVVLVTSGPGFSNTLTGIMNAYKDKTPLVVISGQVESIGNNEFQDADIEEISKTFTKQVFKITKTSDIEKSIKSAFDIADKIPKGPVIVTVPKSVLKDEVIEPTEFRIKKDIKVEAPHSCVLKTIELLKNAKRPIIIAGGGCRSAEKILIELANVTHIPVVHTLMAKGCADDISLGFIGLSGNRVLSNEIYKSDVALCLGTRFSSRTTISAERFLPKTKIISINIEPNTSANVTLSKEIIGELEVVLQQMVGTIKAKNILFDIKYDWIDELSRTVEDVKFDESTLTQESVLDIISRYTEKYRPIITTDVGNHQIAAAKIFKTNSSKRFITSGGFGVMGFGLPAAIGASIAQPNALVMNITGDGSFQMNMQELGTLAEYSLPIKIIVLNNSSLGMVKTLQQRKYSKTYQTDLVNPDFVKIASAYGILGYKISTPDELKCALDEIFTYKKPVLLDIRI